MLCAISGEAPEVPVASRKTGTVFEKRLIEAYIQENGKDPVTGDELSLDDLVELKSARVVKPRPPTLTSIPALLNVFQNEWDAVALETFTLKQHLSQLRQELSTALYNNDAAVRVIARLTKERDEARDALAKVTMQDRRAAGATTQDTGDSMQVDQPLGLPEALAAQVDATQERLSKTRRKRPVPEGWATADSLQSFDFSSSTPIVPPGSRCLTVDATGALAVVGGADGSGCTLSLSSQEKLQFAQDAAHGAMTDVVCLSASQEAAPLFATSSGQVLAFTRGTQSFTFASHAGPVTAVAEHPSGGIVASVGRDKSFVFYDITTPQGSVIGQVFTESELLCCQFHPDGHIFAAGGADGQIKVFDVKTFANAASFSVGGPIQSISFSENGTWLAAAVQGSSSVGVWDLRKAAEIKSLDFGSRIDCVRWDYTGQYLAGAGPGCVAVQHYNKGSKSWSELLKKGCNATAVAWGSQGSSLVVLTAEGAVDILQ